MTTVLEQLKKSMAEDGLPSGMIETIIIVLMHNLEIFNLMKGRWTDPKSDYPDGLHRVIYSNCKPEIFKWLNENAPKAWFKEIFNPELDVESLLKSVGMGYACTPAESTIQPL